MERLLDRINCPADLKLIPTKDLTKLAEEIRKMIISTVSKTGGHLASSLGVVELTIALHYVFDLTKDVIVWDVGHQSYTHKIITGRKDKFHTLRQYGGISGFPKREESPYDAFNTGHSSNSISAALGIAKAKALKGENHKVIAVIGDGAMTGGMAFEGLNQAGHLRSDLLVVLNDNEMCISKSVGALSSFLSRKLSGKFFTRLKRELESFFKSIPGIGENIYFLAKKAEDSLKGFLTPGMIFEALGFEYIGPLQGHRIDVLLETFNNVKDHQKPVLVHVLTTKGKGYPPAENNPVDFHGIGPFDVKTGEGLKEPGVSFTERFAEAITALAKEDERIIAITAAMSNGTGLITLSQHLPQRFFDVGIAEQHAVTFAAGLATEGFIPVIAVYSTFLQRAYDQILLDVCMQKLPVVFVLDRAGIVGQDGSTHHGLYDFSYLRHIPNMVVMAPKDENELQHMLKTATCCGMPVAIRFPRGSGYGVIMDMYPRTLNIGKGEVLKEGEDLAIFAIGSTVYPSLEAAERMERMGSKVAVINSRFVKPLDISLILEFAKRTRKILTVEENVLMGGFGSAILELLEEKRIEGVEVKRLGIPDTFVEHGTQKELRKIYGIDSTEIQQVVEKMVGVREKKVFPIRAYPVS